MGPGAWILAGVNALAAATLLTAGIGKQVAPQPVGRALAEIVRWPGRDWLTGLLRVFAAVELVTAVLLLVVATRTPAAGLTSLLGLSFTVVGLAGRYRRGTAPCGCFGSASSRPLGWVNVLVGVALAAVLPANLVLASGPDYQAGAVLLAVIGSIGLTAFVHRRLIVRLLRPAPAVPAGSEVH